jgi:4-hydroxy-tetrahydrodipicolinate synthase
MARLTEAARGVYVIAVTPFTDDGALDLASIDRMVDFYEEKGATGLTILGQLGEAAKLTSEESRLVAARVIERLAGRLPVVVGVTAPGLAPMRELAESVMDLGAAGVMVAPPWTLRTDDQIFAYFAGVGEALGSTPFVLQDYPLTTNVTIAPAVVERIVREVPTCVMLKHEDWPGLAKIAALRARSDAGAIRRISILCGNGGLFLPEEMARGADGAMTGFCYPEMMVGVVAASAAGDRARAHDIFDAYLPLARYEQQQGIGLASRKYVLAKRGVIASAKLRAPAPRLSADDIADVELLLDRQARRLAEIGLA